ncbi:MAG: adenosine deaminase [Oscillospiraceae bacterium]|nr:adenosine deaminase [Oscillospiraceae bacterium]
MRKYALMDLHLHLDGSQPLSSIKELAAMQNISIPEDDEPIKLIRVSPDCRDLTEYLEKFAFPLSLMQTEEAISKSVYNLCAHLKDQGLIYCEIRFAPQLHCQKGLSQAQVIEAAIDGARKAPIPCSLILCSMRGNDNQEANLETVRLTAKYLGDAVKATDLAGAEALFPTENFRELFDLAQELKIPYTIHAGEADGPDSIKAALSMGTKRIGHGVNCRNDKELMKKLADENVLLELCPTSNLHTCIFSDISQYPINTFLENGIKFSINTDNMAVSGTCLEQEWKLIQSSFKLSHEQIKEILLNTAKASFADAETKAKIISHIESI